MRAAVIDYTYVMFGFKENVMKFQTGFVEYDEQIAVENPTALFKGVMWAIAIMVPFYTVVISFAFWLIHR
jgi:hypothetical protein